MARNRAAIYAELDVLYSLLPTITCQGHCSDSCGPIEMSHRERSRIREQGVEITGHREAFDLLITNAKQGGTWQCDALVDNKCSVYDKRPMICRLWGLSESMACPYGCVPSRYLSDEEMFEFLNASLAIGGTPWDVPPMTPGQMTRDMKRVPGLKDALAAHMVKPVLPAGWKP